MLKDLFFLLFVASIPFFGYSASYSYINILTFVLFIFSFFIQKKEIKIPNSNFINVLYVWLFVGFISSLIFSININLALRHGLDILKIILLIHAFFIVFVNEPKYFDKFIKYLVVFSALNASYYLVFKVSSVVDRVDFGFYVETHTSFFYSLVSILNVYIIINYDMNNIQKIFYNILIPLNLSGVVLSGSRQGILILLMSCIVYVIINKKKIALYISLFIIMGLVYYLFNTDTNFALLRRIYRLQTVVETGSIPSSEGSIYERLFFIKSGINMWLDSVLFGHGFRQFQELIVNFGFSRNAYSHNNYIEVLVSTGLFGFALYVWNYLRLLRKSIMQKEVFSIVIIFVLIVVGLVRITYYQLLESLMISLILFKIYSNGKQ